MPQSVSIDEAGRLRIRLSGSVSQVEFDEMFEGVYRLEAGLNPIPDRISDLTTVTNMETRYEQMLPRARRRAKEELGNAFRNAIVARTPMQFGMARMFQSLNTNPKIEIRIVASMDEALAWLAKIPQPEDDSAVRV